MSENLSSAPEKAKPPPRTGLKWTIGIVSLLLVPVLAWQFPLGREAAIRLAGKVGWPASLVCRGLKDDDHYVKRAAIETLRRSGETFVPAFVSSLQSADADERVQAAQALGLLGSEARAAGSALVAALNDSDARVRGKAAKSLCVVNPDAKEALPRLIELLGDADNEVREEATEAVGVIGRDDPAVVPLLMRLLEDADAGVRAEAAEALGRQETPPVEAVDSLKKLMKEDSDPRVRKQTAETLTRIAPNEFGPSLPQRAPAQPGKR
jgi:HEAT repeat protein